jgi:hypothetical protein
VYISHELHPQPAGAAQGLQVSLGNIPQDLFLKRQISHQLFQPAVLSLKLFQPFGLINAKPAILIAPTIVALLCRSSFLASHSNCLALCLQHLNLAKLRYNLLRRKSYPCHLLSPFQFNTLISSGSEKAGQVSLLRRGAPLGVGQVYDRYKRPNCETIYTLEDRMKAGKPDDFNREDHWMLEYSQRAPIKMVGVWDTVGALGIPVFHIPGFSSSTMGFLHTGLRQSIHNAYHAVAIDEHRKKFAPTLWTKLSSTQSIPRPIESVEQRWFVGAHANVGGGYFSDVLSQPPLKWMMSKANKLGMSFTGDVKPEVLARPTLADSYASFLGGLYSWFSRSYNRGIAAGSSPTGKPGETQQSINETIDASVFDYYRQNSSYRPKALMAWAANKSVEPLNLKVSVMAANPEKSVLN